MARRGQEGSSLLVQHRKREQRQIVDRFLGKCNGIPGGRKRKIKINDRHGKSTFGSAMLRVFCGKYQCQERSRQKDMQVFKMKRGALRLITWKK